MLITVGFSQRCKDSLMIRASAQKDEGLKSHF